MNTDTTLLQKVEELSARVVTLELENRLLRQKLDQYIRHHFGGSRNEGLDKHQLELLLHGIPNVITLPVAEPKTTTATRNGAAHPVRRMLIEDKLEMQEIVIEPQEVQAQPDGWKKISDERTSQLDWVAPKIIKRVYIRPRYVRQERFALAPLPPQPIEQGMVGPGLLAQILVNKYEYHQPLYRQEKMFRQQFGVELSRKTMGGWVEQAAELLKPVYRAIRDDLLAGNYLQADETPIRYLDPDVKGKSQLGYLWVYSRPKSDVLFEWRVSRARAGPEEFLKYFRGKLQTDGYSAYESLAKAREDLTLVGCWAHCRRGFHEALAESQLAAWFVGQIGQLYAAERKLRDKKAGPALRQAMRAWQSQPVLNRLHRAMEFTRRKTLPQGLLGQAIDYTLKRWTALNQFITDGTLEIDNNLIENAIRPSALGKKNWLFVGNPEAGERSAIIYTLLGSCRRQGINSFEYLKDLFTRLPAARITQIKGFTPAAWAKATHHLLKNPRATLKVPTLTKSSSP
ncbi:MAG: IS66 family transposase [Verrucomicrobiota bacterium]|jgi:transposase